MIVRTPVDTDEWSAPPAPARSSSGSTSPDTHFAPAARSTRHELVSARDDLQTTAGFVALLDAIPDWVLVLNRNRQVVWANAAVQTSLGVQDDSCIVGRRPGEIVGCVHADDCAGGCGTSDSCSRCGATRVVLACLASRRPAVGECRVTTRSVASGGSLNLRVNATYLPITSDGMALVVLHDVGAERRADILERSVFHDALDGVSAIYTLSSMMLGGSDRSSVDPGLVDEIHRLSADVIGQIRSLQTLLAAENGELVVRPAELSLRELMVDLAERYQAWDLAAQRVIEVVPPTDIMIRTDSSLLVQVMDDLVRNALEAVEPGGTVRLGATREGTDLRLTVTNSGSIPPELQTHVFQRAFSTKGSRGRGVGTYRARLITARYLLGELSFTSSASKGTTFTVRIPTDLNAAQG